MSYSKLEWQNNVTPLNAANLNRMEDGIEEALKAKDSIVELDQAVQELTTTVNQLQGNISIGTSFDSSTGTLKFILN